jgi:hypothetical protein
MMAFPWPEVAACAGAASATAAWLSAGASREAVARAHRPFVLPRLFSEVPEWLEPEDSQLQLWQVHLGNEGPGVALDVRYSVVFLHEWTRAERKRARGETRRRASKPIRAIHPRQVVDRDHGELLTLVLERTIDTPWWVVVRFTDSAGVRWEYAEPKEVGALAPPPKRLHRRRPRWLRAWLPPAW